ncbi:hypothetical protein [Pseudomonas panipatensis]|uniref:hypothetical protein n=1 Tax=Pseudomonas panipatensis TaxID=428992 RepID=UPI00147F7620|nr:hypothetical protein [Pseudomonas panipatensis]
MNWLAEKERIKQLCWWDEAAERVGLPAHGQVFHMHPIGLVGCFSEKPPLIDVDAFIAIYSREHVAFAPNTPPLSTLSKDNLRNIILEINRCYKENYDKANLLEIAYMLATVRHEANQFNDGEYFSSRPEFGSLSYFNKYDPVLADSSDARENARFNGNTQEGDGYKYRGRGCVHLTWKNNYLKASRRFSIDFISNPDLASEYRYSVPIMIWGMTEGVFTGRKLSDYINSGGVDYLHARKIINGMDKSSLIAGYALRFESILKVSSVLVMDF